MSWWLSDARGAGLGWAYALPGKPGRRRRPQHSSAHAHVLSLSPAACPDWSPVACPTLPDARCVGTHWGQAVSYTHTSWRVADTVCQIGAAVRSSTQEDPNCSEEMGAWLRALEVADLQGAFLGKIPCSSSLLLGALVIRDLQRLMNRSSTIAIVVF